MVCTWRTILKLGKPGELFTSQENYSQARRTTLKPGELFSKQENYSQARSCDIS